MIWTTIEWLSHNSVEQLRINRIPEKTRAQSHRLNELCERGKIWTGQQKETVRAHCWLLYLLGSSKDTSRMHSYLCCKWLLKSWSTEENCYSCIATSWSLKQSSKIILNFIIWTILTSPVSDFLYSTKFLPVTGAVCINDMILFFSNGTGS